MRPSSPGRSLFPRMQAVDAWRAVYLKGRVLQLWHSAARRVAHVIAKVAAAGSWQGASLVLGGSGQGGDGKG